ncbi:MAG: aminotransferase class III-fold pyridoxal phosphate-dependent enzyme [Burkholderiales bacterium]
MTQPLMWTYSRLPLAFTLGEGSWLRSPDGKRYVDCVTGLAVDDIGHAHLRLVGAIAKIADHIIHASKLYRIPELGSNAARLCARSSCRRIASLLKTATAVAA